MRSGKSEDPMKPVHGLREEGIRKDAQSLDKAKTDIENRAACLPVSLDEFPGSTFYKIPVAVGRKCHDLLHGVLELTSFNECTDPFPRGPDLVQCFIVLRMGTLAFREGTEIRSREGQDPMDEIAEGGNKLVIYMDLELGEIEFHIPVLGHDDGEVVSHLI